MTEQTQHITSPFRVPRSRIQAISSPDGHTLDISPLLYTQPAISEISNSTPAIAQRSITSSSSVQHSIPLGKRRKRAKGCMCRQSKCVKLYCDCFRGQRYCSSDCSCTDCENTLENENRLEEVRILLLARNADAFLQTKSEVIKCNCTKSRCLNGYCECIRAGRLCTNACKCNDCNNAKMCATDMPLDKMPLDTDSGINHLDLFDLIK